MPPWSRGRRGAGKRVSLFAGLVAALMLLAAPAPAPAALATTQAAQSGAVSATFTFTGSYPNYAGLHLSIAQGGTVFYNQPVFSGVCGKYCAPGSPSGKGSSVHVLDLEHNGQPDVVLDLYSGGAHCCSIEQIFSFDPGTMTYVMTQHNFGDPGEEIVDLGHNGHLEFLTADDSFAYEFTDYAASGLPIQILTFSGRHFVNVTRHYPKLIARDASGWMKAFNSMAKQHYPDSVGVVAAWAADQELLGHGQLVNRFLSRQLSLGHLNSALSPEEPGGAKFVANLRRFMRRHGYVG
ncbi:MAG TPA: hypothetical protein VHZ27_12875 [Solirubrobacteraceae bacterium]|nr:hypothetical protein [Solirubrobacteraceae bacterium]